MYSLQYMNYIQLFDYLIVTFLVYTLRLGQVLPIIPGFSRAAFPKQFVKWSENYFNVAKLISKGKCDSLCIILFGILFKSFLHYGFAPLYTE